MQYSSIAALSGLLTAGSEKRERSPNGNRLGEHKGKGQLGTEIIKQLREGRSEIGPIPEKLMNATVIPVDLPELDISNYKMVDDFIRRQRPDVIINCAAYTNVDGCEVNHDAAFKANALGPRNLAQAAEKTGARLVHVSTAAQCNRTKTAVSCKAGGHLPGAGGR